MVILPFCAVCTGTKSSDFVHPWLGAGGGFAAGGGCGVADEFHFCQPISNRDILSTYVFAELEAPGGVSWQRNLDF